MKTEWKETQRMIEISLTFPLNTLSWMLVVCSFISYSYVAEVAEII